MTLQSQLQEATGEPETGQPQQQTGIRCLPCFDDLINFIKSYFSSTKAAAAAVAHRPILEFKRYSGNSAQYQTLIDYKIPDNAKEAKIKGLGIVCDAYTTLYLYIKVQQVELVDAQIQVPYNLPYDDLILKPTPDTVSQIIVKARSDGATAIVVDASLVGYEVY